MNKILEALQRLNSVCMAQNVDFYQHQAMQKDIETILNFVRDQEKQKEKGLQIV